MSYIEDEFTSRVSECPDQSSGSYLESFEKNNGRKSEQDVANENPDQCTGLNQSLWPDLNGWGTGFLAC